MAKIDCKQHSGLYSLLRRMDHMPLDSLVACHNERTLTQAVLETSLDKSLPICLGRKADIQPNIPPPQISFFLSPICILGKAATLPRCLIERNAVAVGSVEPGIHIPERGGVALLGFELHHT